MFDAKNEQVKRLEKKMENLERKMNMNFLRIGDSLQTISDVITKMQQENRELKKDRDFLVEKHKELMRSIETESRLVKEMKERFIAPARNAVKEDIELFKQAVKEGVNYSKKDELFDMVMKSGRVKLKEAARKLSVHDLQIETWAHDLQKAGLIDIFDNGNYTELRKKP